MSLVEDFERIMLEQLTPEEQGLLEPLTRFVTLAWDAGYQLDGDLSKASRLEVLARAAAHRARETDRVVREATAQQGPAGLAVVMERTDGGAAGAELVAQIGLQLARANPSASAASPRGVKRG